MRRYLVTLRFKLTVLYAVVFAGVWMAVLVVACVAGERALRRQLDHRPDDPTAAVATPGTNVPPPDSTPGSPDRRATPPPSAGRNGYVSARGEALRDLRRALGFGAAAALILSAVAAWFLAGRALDPIARVAAVAEQFHAERFTHPLEAPAGQDALANMIARINAMLDRLSEGVVSHERFIADAAHELKTPLAVLLGEAQVLMQQDRTTEEYVRFVADVQDQARALGQVVDSLLTLARAEAGIPVVGVTDVSLNEIVMDAVQRCGPLAAQKEVRVVPNLALPGPGAPEPIVAGDGALLRVMVGNLLRNAIRYSPPQRAVDLTVRLEAHNGVITVGDQGPGIPPQFLEKVFDRFFSVPESGTHLEGVGLGLTIARGVARLHGGAVSVTNRPTGGCEFSVRLPLIPAATQ